MGQPVGGVRRQGGGLVYWQWLILTLTLEEGGFFLQPLFLGLGS